MGKRVGEVYIAPEMIAAGLDAKNAAQRDCLTDGELVLEIYLAMYGAGIRAMCEGEETLQ